MGIESGLAALNKTLNKVAESQSDRPKAAWLKIDPGKTVEVRFLQEIDADSEYYSEKNGLVLAASEHTKPGDYRTKAVCTMDEEGRCYGCEQHALDFKAGWKARTRLYANVLVDGEVCVLSQGFSGKAITPALLMAAEANGGITRTVFKMGRMGSGTDTSYTLFPAKQDESFDPEKYELYDLTKVAVRMVPYSEQAAFFNGGEAPATPDPEEIW